MEVSDLRKMIVESYKNAHLRWQQIQIENDLSQLDELMIKYTGKSYDEETREYN